MFDVSLLLLVAKCSRLEVYLISPEGLQLMLDVNLYGRIASMGSFAPNSNGNNGFTSNSSGSSSNSSSSAAGGGVNLNQKHVLYILTERFQLCVVQYNEATGELETIAKVTRKQH